MKKVVNNETLGIIFNVWNKINNSKEASECFKEYGGCCGDMTRRWRNAAGNHAFDDNHEKFGISEHEGHVLRSYFQETEDLGEEVLRYINSTKPRPEPTPLPSRGTPV